MPKYELIFGKDLIFVIVLFGCSIPTSHDVYIYIYVYIYIFVLVGETSS